MSAYATPVGISVLIVGVCILSAILFMILWGLFEDMLSESLRTKKIDRWVVGVLVIAASVAGVIAIVTGAQS